MNACRTYRTWAVALLIAAPALAQDWRYHAPEAADRLPVRCSVNLQTTEKARADVTVELPEPDDELRFASITFGSPGAIPFTFAVGRYDGDMRLWVDRNRDRVLAKDEEIKGAKGRWSTRLNVLILGEKDRRYVARDVVIAWNDLLRSLSITAPGHIEGTAQLGAKTVRVRRMDGNANGLLTDRRDHLWIDLDGDGAFDPFEERFPWRSALRLDGHRYTALSDPFGDSLRFAEVKETGEVALVRRPASVKGEIEQVSVLLQGRDGSAFTIEGVDKPVALPAGEYRIQMVTLSMQGGAMPLTFVFSDSGGRDKKRWYKVGAERRLDLDPVGRLEFSADLKRKNAVFRPGDDVDIDPRLYTEDGLLINTCFTGFVNRGYTWGGPEASIELKTAKGKVVDTASSGFA